MFFFSGWCGLSYQIVWTRIAFSTFGAITLVLSVVISVFMLGMFVGSWAGGKWADLHVSKKDFSPLIVYGLCELCIALGGLIVPRAFSFGSDFLLSTGSMDGHRYLFFSAVVIAISILPSCICMGATFPLMMAFVKKREASGNFQATSFSYLYQANIVGALCGVILTTTVLVEYVGFSMTLLISASFNLLIAIASFTVVYYLRSSADHSNTPAPRLTDRIVVDAESFPVISELSASGTKLTHSEIILFMSGFVSMAAEVVWTRAFTPVLTTTIYAFGALLAVYCLATGVGVFMYRRHAMNKRGLSTSKLLTYTAAFSFLPIVLNDPRFFSNIFVVLVSLMPFCAALGYLTPKLVDHYSAGSPLRAGRAYAINILGCIIGPLIAGYVMLPYLGVRFSMVLLAIPFMAFSARSMLKEKHLLLGALSYILLVIAVFVSVSHEDGYDGQKQEIRRDYTATVISRGEGMRKELLVNGIGMTGLTPIAKIMAHLPMVFQESRPSTALVICFGMGITYRSLMSWDIDVTAVELVPTVRDAFGYYFGDASELLKNPKGRIVIDDGRRFLLRTDSLYDVITIDPPPPIEAAGSSLLYSKEFYEVVKQHLAPDGVLHVWFPGGEEKILVAVMNSLSQSFPHCRMYSSIAGWGFHFIASLAPLRQFTAQEMVARMPQRAVADLLEWFPGLNAEAIVQGMLSMPVDLPKGSSLNAGMMITDDRPYNEYYLMRRLKDRLAGTGINIH